MGGYINGIMGRVPGAKLMCNRCKKVFDESEFHYMKSKGYSSYCIPCHRYKQTEYRKLYKAEDYVKQTRVTTNRHETLPIQNAFNHRVRLYEVRNNVRIGDTFYVDGERAKVVIIQKHYIVVQFRRGTREGFIWDDVLKLVEGTYVREGKNTYKYGLS